MGIKQLVRFNFYLILLIY